MCTYALYPLVMVMVHSSAYFAYYFSYNIIEKVGHNQTINQYTFAAANLMADFGIISYLSVISPLPKTTSLSFVSLLLRDQCAVNLMLLHFC